MPDPITGKLKWDQYGEHFFENGVSQGVLYPSDPNGTDGWGKGVAWNGLRTVSETPEGADESAFYADNAKYLSLRAVETFGGTIGAYTYPDEWMQCDGSAQPVAGVTFGQQTRKPFCFAFKSQLGNDVLGSDYGYLLHIVYNATASPSSREYQTINESPEPIEFSWEFKTTPLQVTGYKPVSLITINSKKVDADDLAALEAALFGVDPDSSASPAIVGSNPRIVLPAEILTMFPAG